jgi:hypothetical protein
MIVIKASSLELFHYFGGNHVKFHTSPIATGQIHMGLQYESIYSARQSGFGETDNGRITI